MKYLSILLLVLVAFIAEAQRYEDVNDPNEIKSILSKDNEIQGFGGIDGKLGDIKGDRTLFIGGYGGVIVNRSFMFGIRAYGLASQPGFEGTIPGTVEVKELKRYGGYGGLLIGATVFGKEVIHLSAPVLLGAGNLEISDDNFFELQFASETDFTVERSAFFIVEPGLQLEFNITSYLRLAGGATYRWVQGLELENATDRDMSGWGGSLSLRVGRF